MLVELGVVEQRYAAVLEVVRDGVSVTEVAFRMGWPGRLFIGGCGVTRRRVWLVWWIGSPTPDSCPHQMPAVVEARIVELRRANPVGGRGRCCSGWRLRVWSLCRVGHPVYRALVRHGLIEPEADGDVRRITSVGSGPGRWSCGRWTWWVG